MKKRIHPSRQGKTSALVFIVLMFAALSGHAQSPVEDIVASSMPRPVPLSPNAAALGKFGDYEVSNYTGLPEITIPIFEVQSGGLKIPITLSYHASGVKMFDPGSWVGYGWSLNTGGQVTREVRAMPDENRYYTSPLYETLSLCSETGGNYVYIDKIANEIYDADPDIFSYSIPGKSGRFTLGHNGESPYLFPMQPVKIWHPGMDSYAGESIPFGQFDITNDDGVLYRFGRNSAGQSAAEGVTAVRTPFPSLNYSTGFLLTEVIAPNSEDTIFFDYQDAGNAYIVEPRSFITVIDQCVSGTPYKPCPPQGPQVLYSGQNAYTLTERGLREIIFEGGKLKFILGGQRLDNFGGNSSLQTLDRIEVYSLVGNVYSHIKTIKFVYDYFGYTSDTSAKVRLKLTELQFFGADDLVNPVDRYSFTYHTNNFSWMEVGGAYYQKAKDFWGYYNGHVNNDLIPPQSIQWTDNGVTYYTANIGSADRSTNPTFMKEGVLKRITFPTGGYTEFDYETNKYMEGSTPTYAGGLRVTNIKSYDGTGAVPITKTYKYGEGETGYGVKNFFNSMLYYKTEDAVHDICCLIINPPPICPGDVSYTVRNYFSNSAIEIGSGEGSPVVYPVVTEYFGDQTTNIGKIIYEYDNKTYVADSLNIIIGPQSSKNYKADLSWRRGYLTKKTVYDNTGKVMSESTNTYSLFRLHKKHIGTAVDPFREYPTNQICYSECTTTLTNLKIDHMQYLYANYYQSTGGMRLTSSTEITYQDGVGSSSVSRSSTRAYDQIYLIPTSSDQTDHNGGTITSYTKYPFSYIFLGGETSVSKAILGLKNKNALTIPIETYSVRRDNGGTNARVLSGQISTFIENPNNIKQVVADSLFFLENDVTIPLASFSVSSLTASKLIKDSRYKLRARMKFYDGRGNIGEVERTDDKTTTYLWGYRNSSPIAEVQNTDKGEQTATYQDLTYVGKASYSSTISTDTQLSPSLVISTPQVVYFSVYAFQPTNVQPSSTPTLDIVLKKSDGTVIYDPAAYNFGMNEGSVYLANGTYNFFYKGNPYGTTVSFKITVDYQTKNSTNLKVFHTSFEETGTIASDARTGKRINSGAAYVVNLPTVNGSYILTWWQRSTLNIWSLQTVPITIPGASTYSIGSSTIAVDEVRLYPVNSLMTTYTTDPVLGTTSSTDANNVTTYYEYDGFGRLQTIKDANANIVKAYKYHYYKEK